GSLNLDAELVNLDAELEIIAPDGTLCNNPMFSTQRVRHWKSSARVGGRPSSFAGSGAFSSAQVSHRASSEEAGGGTNGRHPSSGRVVRVPRAHARVHARFEPARTLP